MLLPSGTVAPRALIGVVVAVGLVLEAAPVDAGVRTSTQIEAYRV